MDAKPKPRKRLVGGTLASVWRRGNSSVLARVKFEEKLHQQAGAPSEAWLRYDFGAEKDGVGVSVTLINKTATRLPEATYVTFRPLGSDNGTWMHNILGEWSLPDDVATGASFGLHYVTEEGVRLDQNLHGSSGGGVHVTSLDAGLLRWGSPLPFPTPLRGGQLDMAEGASFCLHNNIWNTNYPCWMPFDDQGRNLKFRFRMFFSR
uniref:Uncharacterized protein n=1 Tax=Lotharella oceanica TaxID=641309 RepID=A0A7S2TUG9_9EUKA